MSKAIKNEISSLDEVFEIDEQRKLHIVFNRSPLKSVKLFFCNEIEGEALFGSGDPETMKKNFMKTYPENAQILTLGSMYISKIISTKAASVTVSRKGESDSIPYYYDFYVYYLMIGC